MALNRLIGPNCTPYVPIYNMIVLSRNIRIRHYYFNSCASLMASSRRTVSFSSVHPLFSESFAKDTIKTDNACVLKSKSQDSQNEEEARNPDDIERILGDDETLNKRLLSLRGSLRRRGSSSRVSRLDDKEGCFYFFIPQVLFLLL